MTEQRDNQPNCSDVEQRGVVDQVAQAAGDTVSGLPKEVVGGLAAQAVVTGAKKVIASVKGKPSNPERPHSD